jgi:hypothetical protein
MGTLFDQLREILSTAIQRDFPAARLEDFPADSEVAGTKVVLESPAVLADIFLYENGALDIEALETSSDKVVLRIHTPQTSAAELEAALAKLARSMR